MTIVDQRCSMNEVDSSEVFRFWEGFFFLRGTSLAIVTVLAVDADFDLLVLPVGAVSCARGVSPLEPLVEDFDLENQLSGFNIDIEGKILRRREPTPQKRNAKADNIPKPVTAPKFFNQLPTLEMNEIWGVSL